MTSHLARLAVLMRPRAAVLYSLQFCCLILSLVITVRVCRGRWEKAWIQQHVKWVREGVFIPGWRGRGGGDNSGGDRAGLAQGLTSSISAGNAGVHKGKGCVLLIAAGSVLIALRLCCQRSLGCQATSNPTLVCTLAVHTDGRLFVAGQGVFTWIVMQAHVLV